MPKRITRQMQIEMGLVDPAPRGHRSRESLGLPTEQQQRKPTTITRIEPASPSRYDWSHSDQPYRATKGEHIDIAKGFTYIALPVSFAASLAVALTGWVGAGVPVWSMLTFLLIVGTFTVSYFSCWILSNFFSHYGVQLAQVLLGYRLLRHDQIERHKFYKEQSK